MLVCSRILTLGIYRIFLHIYYDPSIPFLLQTYLISKFHATHEPHRWKNRKDQMHFLLIFKDKSCRNFLPTNIYMYIIWKILVYPPLMVQFYQHEHSQHCINTSSCSIKTGRISLCGKRHLFQTQCSYFQHFLFTKPSISKNQQGHLPSKVFYINYRITELQGF